MSLSSKQLEAEIQAMESRLASAKITVALEKTAWQKVARKGKSGAKWKGAATTKTTSATGKTSSRSEIENAEGEIVVAPSEWDSLELAQYLQARQLAPYAQLVVYEHITGKLLLTTAPGKLRHLFDGIVAGKSDPTWKHFLRVTSQLYKLQKSMDPSRCGGQQDEDMASNPPASPLPPRLQSCGTVFPLISPRVPVARAAPSLSTKPQRPQPPPPMASLVIGDVDSNRLKSPAPQGRKSLRSANHHHGHTQQQMVTCWNCSARFPRSMPATSSSRSLLPTASVTSSKAITAKLFCSKACQDAIESSDMSVSSSLRLAVPLDSISHLQAAPKASPPPSDPPTTALVKSPRGSSHSVSAAGASFDFLRVTPTGPQAPSGTPHEMPGVARPLRGRKRAPPPANASSSHSPVASITAVRFLSDDVVPPQFLLHGARSSSRLEPRVVQQSRYKLDPELFHAYGIGWATCFDATAPLSPMRAMGRSHDYRITNLETLTAFMSPKAIYRLSLTSRKWFELVHTHAATVDRIWGLLLQRAWLHDDADRICLRELGFVSSSSQPKRPRRVLMKLTRQLQRTVLDGMKILLNADAWQLAPTCRHDRDYLPLPHTRWQWAALNTPPNRDACARGDDLEQQEPIVDRGNDLYEIITVICTRACEIVAVQAQDLIRPIADDGSTIEILKGVSNGSLWCVACRRLRLFSQANRLPFSEWYLLPDVLVMLEFCMVTHAPSQLPTSEPAAPTTWQLKVLSRLQMQMDKRLLAKESVQQLMKSAQERNAPEPALTALEQFLVRHAPSLVGNSSCSVSGKPRG